MYRFWDWIYMTAGIALGGAIAYWTGNILVAITAAVLT